MKKYFLIAIFLFSCTSEIESPEAILERISSTSEVKEAYDVLKNGDFEHGSLPWETYFGEGSGKIELKNESPSGEDWGNDIIFTPTGKEAESWYLQLKQTNLNIKIGYSYTLTYYGNATKSLNGTGPIWFSILKCKEDYTCDPIREWTKASLPLTPAEYKEVVWDNCLYTEPNATFVISGGLAKTEFKIAWIDLRAEPIDCP